MSEQTSVHSATNQKSMGDLHHPDSGDSGLDSESLATEDVAGILAGFFRRGMLTVHAERLIGLALQDLETLEEGWNGERVKDWIENEKQRISQRSQFDEVSALADALNWAIKHPDPDPANPAETFHWPNGMNNVQHSSMPEDFGQRGAFQAQMQPVTSMAMDGAFTQAHEFGLQQNGEFDGQNVFDEQTNVSSSTSQIHPSLQNLGFGVMGNRPYSTEEDVYFGELGSRSMVSDPSIYPRYATTNGFMGASTGSLGNGSDGLTSTAIDDNHLQSQKIEAQAQAILDNLEAYGQMSSHESSLSSAAGAINGNVSSSTHNHAAQNDQLAGLLKAVSSAVGQEAQMQATNTTDAANSASERPRRTARKTRTSGMKAPEADMVITDGTNKRKRKASGKATQNKTPQDSQGEDIGAPSFIAQRRRKSTRGEVPDEASEEEEDDEEANDDNTTLEIRELPPQVAMSDARAAGVHSAAALFRRPSASSKKYTRPPMSKLFSSLELSPENFLHLQAAAKGFMLDKRYPDRQNCVGSRGKGDSDMVKLRLYNCVKDFLEIEGNGERFFGRNVPPAEQERGDRDKQRKFIWPAQKNKIISLVTPLLRRMVTNERQRQYAIETRKGGAAGSKKRKASEMETPPRADSNAPSDLDSSNGVEEALFHHFNGADGDSFVDDEAEPRPTIADLRLVSGLASADFDILVATVEGHLGYTHHGDPGSCNSQCVDRFFHEAFIRDMGYLQKSGWSRAGNDIEADPEAKREFAHEIIRDLFAAITANMPISSPPNQEPAKKKRRITARNGLSTQTLTPPETSHDLFAPIPPNTTAASSSTSAHAGIIKMEINILSNNKRLRSPINITSQQAPDFASLWRFIGTRGLIKAHLPEGIVAVDGEDGYVNMVQRVLETVWLGGEVKILVFTN